MTAQEPPVGLGEDPAGRCGSLLEPQQALEPLLTKTLTSCATVILPSATVVFQRS